MGPADYKVLVVDDEQAVARVTVATLQSELGGDIEMRLDPLEAVQVLQEEEVAVLVTDFKMPGLTGQELARQAKEVSPDTVCILVTAFTSKDLLMEILNEGCVWKCMDKPWQPDDMIGNVGEALALYHSRRAHIEEPPVLPPEPEPETEPAKPAVSVSSKPKVVIRKGASRLGARRISRGRPQGIRIRPKSKAVKGKKREAQPQEAAPKPETVTHQRYRDLTLIAEGGSGAIYRAMDSLLGMEVAIKVLGQHIAEDQDAINELFAEARIAMQLSHKHIVRLHNIEALHHQYYLVMEYIEGGTLRTLMEQDGVLEPATVAQIVDICEDAFGYAHRRNIYHRDIKPDNFMVSNDGLLKIIDFGLACLSQRPGDDDNIRGTPYYVSPEELRGDPIDHRSDIFSLAIMMHELLTGSIPFAEGEEDVEMTEFVPVPSSELPPEVQQFFVKAFAADPEDRHQDVHELAKAFRAAVGVSA